jgi:addiction module RelE/StbE family toxin
MSDITVEYTKLFEKQIKKLGSKVKDKFKVRQRLLIESPHDPQLNNHALKGSYQGYRSINVTGDIRALYTQRGSTIIIFAIIGSHSELYK